MTIVKHELRLARIPFLIWTGVIAFFLAICVFMYPEMKSEMNEFSDIFASMGSFTAAFGMDRLNFGTLVGFYSIECGNILGIGGAFFAALLGAGIIAKEEKEHTAEFLLTHPVSRGRVLTEKLAAVDLQLIVMNLLLYLLAVVCIAAIGEEIPWKILTLMHLAYFMLQLELAGICFGISAFMKRGSVGVGIGIAAMAYFVNIIANMTDSVDFLKYITPFGYCEGADIVEKGTLDGGMIVIGMVFMVIGIAAAYVKYCKKDIA